MEISSGPVSIAWSTTSGMRACMAKRIFCPAIWPSGTSLKSRGYLVFDPAETVGRDAGLQVDSQSAGCIGESCRQTDRLQ